MYKLWWADCLIYDEIPRRIELKARESMFPTLGCSITCNTHNVVSFLMELQQNAKVMATLVFQLLTMFFVLFLLLAEFLCKFLSIKQHFWTSNTTVPTMICHGMLNYVKLRWFIRKRNCWKWVLLEPFDIFLK